MDKYLCQILSLLTIYFFCMLRVNYTNHIYDKTLDAISKYNEVLQDHSYSLYSANHISYTSSMVPYFTVLLKFWYFGNNIMKNKQSYDLIKPYLKKEKNKKGDNK